MQLVWLSDGPMLEIPEEIIPKQDEKDDFGGLPQEILLVKIGKNPYTKGADDGEFECSEEDLKALLEDFQKRGKDIPLDYNHGSVGFKTTTGEAPQAGWINKLEIDPRGLIGKIKGFTPRAMEMAKAKELPRYISPALYFDDSGKHPVQLHSVGLTNTPSFHNPEALFAANDELRKEEVGLKRKNTIQSFKDTIDGMHKAHSGMVDAMLSAIQDFHNFVKDNPEELHDMQVFNDSLIGQGVITFADVQAEIVQKRDTMTGPELLDWLNQRIQSAVNDYEKSAIQGEMARLNAFKMEKPELWNAGATGGVAKPLQGTASMGVAVTQSAPKIPMAYNDLGVKSDEDASKKVKDLVKYKNDGDAFMKQYGVQTFSDVSKVMSDKMTKAFNDLKEKDAAVKSSEASIKVQKLVDDGRILPSQKATYQKLAIESPSTFNDLTAALKPRIEKGYNDLLDNLTKDGKSEDNNQQEGPGSEAQNKRARLMGFNDYADYRTRSKAAKCFVAF